MSVITLFGRIERSLLVVLARLNRGRGSRLDRQNLGPGLLQMFVRRGSLVTHPQTWHGAHHHTVHQERYNPLKLGDQPQEAWAKVRQDFGVRSVTLWAWEPCPT